MYEYDMKGIRSSCKLRRIQVSPDPQKVSFSASLLTFTSHRNFLWANFRSWRKHTV